MPGAKVTGPTPPADAFGTECHVSDTLVVVRRAGRRNSQTFADMALVPYRRRAIGRTLEEEEEIGTT
jgi:hypothetical protein